MRILVADDDYISSELLTRILAPYGEVTNAPDGRKAIESFTNALDDNRPFRLVCLDIMMPEMNGQDALKTIRQIERDRGIPSEKEALIVMTTSLDDRANVVEAYYRGGATSYVPKPIDKDLFLQLLRGIGLI
ncbi:two-component system chemotaxis response regulator CheY [Desulfobaculum xiamenense]|uniref:Two-component system chemotaxis response regulator CheY n=1 Tax=Desulfobaculum xiamenense TaxID=995050 RepID=A0A846QQ20_9BACT|nr:response regulator [Desulfobaculum xiamenense]NJB67314.1 two-component system chemotaxis response regulator CheY [Desulfobaculum xiamenense]